MLLCVSVHTFLLGASGPTLTKKHWPQDSLEPGKAEAGPSHGSLSVRSQWPCHKDTHATPWMAPPGKELRSPANSQTRELSWKQLLQPERSLVVPPALPYVTAAAWGSPSQYSMASKPWPALHRTGFPGGPLVRSPSARAGDAGDSGSVPGSGRSPGEGNGNPLQYSWG